MVNTEAVLKHSERALIQRAESTLVLLDLDTGEYYALNEVGGRVWELCDGVRSVSEVMATIRDEYEAPAETIEADVLEVLGELTDEGLLVQDK